MTTTTLAAAPFAREEHPVGEITLPRGRGKTDRVSALVGYRLGRAADIGAWTRVDGVDFVAYDTAN
jgi:hypothetical protein